MSTPHSRPVHILAGPTAAGKTALAHRIAREHGWAILSADAMLVYEGMDIGTAKPSADERAGLTYGGIDLVTPDQSFSVGAYLNAARDFLHRLPPDQTVLVVGGTGLYIKALITGLDPMPPVDPAVRDAVQAIYDRDGIDALREICAREAPDRYAALSDPSNPRRLMRALELGRMNVPFVKSWIDVTRPCGAVLMPDRSWLDKRIAQRVDAMYDGGLLNEVHALRERFPKWSDTASMGIGYREAQAVLDGEMDEPEARRETISRTRQYARRQLTWFRHQLPLVSVPVTVDLPEDDVIMSVETVWSTHGPCPILN